MKFEAAMRSTVRAGVIVLFALGVLAMHGSTPVPGRADAFAPAVESVGGSGLMKQASGAMQDMNIHGAGAICLWTLVGGVLIAMVSARSTRPRRLLAAADSNAVAFARWNSKPVRRTDGPDPPFSLCTLRR